MSNCYLGKALSNTSHAVYKTVHLANDKVGAVNRTLNRCVHRCKVRNLEFSSLKNFIVYCFDYDMINTSILIKMDLGSGMRNSCNMNAILDEHLRLNDFYAIYTDGRKNVETGSSVGSAFLYTYDNSKFGFFLSGDSATFMAEVFAFSKL